MEPKTLNKSLSSDSKMKLTKILTILSILTFLLLSVNMVTARYSSREIPIKYNSVAQKDTYYYTQMKDYLPTNLKKVQSIVIELYGDYTNAGVSGVIKLGNGTIISCNPESWSTGNAKGYKTYFTCTDIPKKFNEKFQVGYVIDKKSNNVYGKIIINYETSEISLNVYGTEYTVGQNATTFLQLRDANGNTVDNASCNLNVYYPDKTKWQDNVAMDFLENGLYYYDTVTPSNYGVYMLAVYCSYETSEQVYTLPDSLSYDGTLKDGSTGSTAEVEYSDGIFLRTDAGYYHQFNFIDSGIGNINTSSLTDLKITWIGQNEKTSELQAYNFNTLSWDTVGSTFIRSKDKNGEVKNSHGISREIMSNIGDYIGGIGSNEVRIRIYMTEHKKILTDNIEIRFQTNGASINDIRGSGEIHVSPTVWRDVYDDERTITNLTILGNQTFNNSQVVSDIWNYNGTINNNLLSQFVNAVWSYTGTITSTILNAFGLNVWNQPSRNLTYYAPTTDETNYTKINVGVWNYNNRNLSFFDYPLQSDYVWNNTNRNLTQSTQINETSISESVWNYSGGRYTHGIIIP